MLVEQQELKRGAGDTPAGDGGQTEHTKGDVVILYESNLEESTEALSDATPKPRPPNQHVETIVYDEEESETECSEVSETYTKEDLNELCLINSEALDFINIPSVDTHCHKQNMKIKPSGYISDYKKHSFEIMYSQLNFNSFGSLMSTSLMDILCSNQKSDDACYMDNLISHVQYTIEELKRISNGEYLSERTKQKWVDSMEPRRFTHEKNREKREREFVDTKIKSQPVVVSYPEQDKVIHTAIRSVITTHAEINRKIMNEILREKVIVRVPKVLCNPVTLFSDLDRNNFVLEGRGDNRISRDFISRMIITTDLRYPIFSPLCWNNFKIVMPTQNFNIAVIKHETNDQENNLLAIEYCNESNLKEECVIEEVKCEEKEDNYVETNSVLKAQDIAFDDDILNHYENSLETETSRNVCRESLGSYIESIASLPTDVSVLSTEKLSVEKYSSTSSSLGCSVKQMNSKLYLNIKTAGNLKVKKKSSPTTLKIKSPYENNSHVFEEKKRKRLLKIRERREKIRNTTACRNKDNSKTGCNQDLRSETKLILTGKSSPSSDDKENRKRTKKRKNKFTSVKNIQSYMENMKPFGSSANSSIIINNFSQYLEPLVSQQDFKVQINDLPNVIDRDGIKEENNLYTTDIQEEDELAKLIRRELYSHKEDDNSQEIVSAHSKFNQNIPPVNTPIESAHETSKSLLTKECKHSIDKLYSLIKDLANPISSDKAMAKNEMLSEYPGKLNVGHNIESIAIADDVNRSNIKDEALPTKHNMVSTEKLPSGQVGNSNNKKIEIVAHMPPVSLPTKTQSTKCEKNVKGRRKHSEPQSENTLKAISQFLHKFDNVQRLNHKTLNATKSPRNTCETIKETKKPVLPPVVPKSVRPEKVFKDTTNTKDHLSTKGKPPTVKTLSDKAPLRPKSPEGKKTEEKVKSVEKDATVERSLGRTRLDALAQPRKTHVAANNRDYRTPNLFPVHGSVLVNYRQQRNTNTSLIPQRIRNIIAQNGPQNKTSDAKHTKASPRTQEETETRRSHHNSPERKRLYENKKVSQTKNNNVYNPANCLKNSNLAVPSHAKASAGIVSPRRKDFRKLQKPSVPSIAEQDDLAIPGSRTEAPLGSNTDEVNDALTQVPESAKANDLVNIVKGPTPQVCNGNNIVAHLNHSKSHEIISSSDFKIDVFEDGNINTAVANTFARNIFVNSRILYKKHNFLKSQGRASCSLTRLEKLVTGPGNGKTFCAQTRFKDLSPKRSFQQIFVLQSGDTGSLIVKSIISQNTNTFDIMPKISIQSFTKSSIDWTSETLSLHYFPVLHSMQCSEPDNILKERVHNSFESTRKIKRTESNPNFDINWQSTDLNDADESNTCNNDKDVNNNESFFESTIQSETVSELKDIIVTDVSKLEIVNSLESSIANTNISRICDKTTSMDILVDLLKEIKTISTYHANNAMIQNEHFKIATNEGIINDNVNTVLSISEMDTHKTFESTSSVHTFFTNEEFKANNNESGIHKPEGSNVTEHNKMENICMDKEVSACLEEKEVANRCTDIPSKEMLLSTDQSVAVSTSLSLISNQDKTITDSTVLHAENLRDYFTKDDARDNIEIKDTDQHLKLKRDILVTVYSFLVLTVFVALTYPDIVARM